VAALQCASCRKRARGSMEFCHLWPEGSIVGVEFLGKRQLAHCPLPIFLYMYFEVSRQLILRCY